MQGVVELAERPFDAYRKRKAEQANAAYDAFIAGGFPLENFPGETLQCRNDTDRSNWFEVRDLCREMIFADPLWADLPFPDPGLRCTSNAFVLPTVGEVLQILTDMRAWVFAGQMNLWRLKDAVRDCTTRAGLNTINTDEGWP